MVDRAAAILFENAVTKVSKYGKSECSRALNASYTSVSGFGPKFPEPIRAGRVRRSYLFTPTLSLQVVDFIAEASGN